MSVSWVLFIHYSLHFLSVNYFKFCNFLDLMHIPLCVSALHVAIQFQL
jgi:hypothetical protein